MDAVYTRDAHDVHQAVTLDQQTVRGLVALVVLCAMTWRTVQTDSKQTYNHRNKGCTETTKVEAIERHKFTVRDKARAEATATALATWTAVTATTATATRSDPHSEPQNTPLPRLPCRHILGALEPRKRLVQESS